jgi:hypothetical protein
LALAFACDGVGLSERLVDEMLPATAATDTQAALGRDDRPEPVPLDLVRLAFTGGQLSTSGEHRPQCHGREPVRQTIEGRPCDSSDEPGARAALSSSSAAPSLARGVVERKGRDGAPRCDRNH